jgi:hypothetical protein
MNLETMDMDFTHLLIKLIKTSILTQNLNQLIVTGFFRILTNLI